MKKISNNKKIYFVIVFALLLIVLVVGSTYAYFSAVTTSDEYITGSSAVKGESLKVEVNQVSTGTGKLIPQLDNAIGNAVIGASGKGSCLDDNGNTICKVYSIKVTNLSKVKINVTGTLQLIDDDNNTSIDSMPNLKWAKGSSATSDFPTPANTYYNKTDTALADDILEPSGSANDNKTYFVVVWISEKNEAQTDQKKYKGEVTFNAYTNTSGGEPIEGLTSTFTG